MRVVRRTRRVLYLIEILHQTTTGRRWRGSPSSCILSKFYIKPQPYFLHLFHSCSCILSKFYIKPQQCHDVGWLCPVVSYRNSTSNHNLKDLRLNLSKLYLIEILHQTTTRHVTGFYNPTLYLIEILHQTTTSEQETNHSRPLYLIEILHQTTTLRLGVLRPCGCILSKFYIKPQRHVA